MNRRKPDFPKHLLLLAVVSSFSLYQSALAAPCTEQVDALKTALNDQVCVNSKLCSGLSHKLDNANLKLEQGKLDHAARRLADFNAVVADMTMLEKPKITQADYESIIVPVFNEAVACINNGGVIPDNTVPTEVDDTPTNTDDGGIYIPPNIAF